MSQTSLQDDHSGVFAPLHGFAGPERPAEMMPVAPSIAVSRQVGARGRSIAVRVGRLLGWAVYDQEELESLSQDGALHDAALADLSPSARQWADERLAQLQDHQVISRNAGVAQMARLILALGAHGEAVFVGRGAGFLLPPRTTLHARVVAPLAARVAAIGQWQRLTRERAAEEGRRREQVRTEYLAAHFPGNLEDPARYDLVLNSAQLGEELTADLLAQAARRKWPGPGADSGNFSPGA